MDNSTVVVNDEVGAELADDLSCHVGIQTPLRDHQEIERVEIGRQEGYIRAAIFGWRGTGVRAVVSQQDNEIQYPNAYLWMETRKLTIVTIRTKMSTVLHFAKASSHKKMVPRLETDTVVGGVNQSHRVRSCFVYGQANEVIKMRIASSWPPAKRNGIKIC